MSLLQNSNAISTGGADYNLESSLRFRNSASAYLSRTPASAGSTTTGTISTWFKIGSNVGGILFEQGNGTNTNRVGIWVSVTTSKLQGYVIVGGTTYSVISNAVLRDYSAWYHVVLTVDTTNSTAGDRLRLYLNGERISLGTDQASSIPQNQVTQLNGTGPSRIGYNQYATSYYFDGYMTEFNLVDGQALTADDFGEYDDTTGVWKPKEYTGTYGTNGFYLPMKETQQATGFNTVLWTGDGGTQSISNVGFSPDFVWGKQRNGGGAHYLYDSVRGATKHLNSEYTYSEGTSTGLTSFDSNGFTIGSNSSMNGSGLTYVGWCWDAGSDSSYGIHYNNASSSGVTLPSGGFGSGDFTLEYYVRHHSFQDYDTHFTITRGATGFNVGSDGSRDLVWADNVGGSLSRKIEVIGAFELNKWHHVAFVRSSGVLKAYLDGTQVGSDFSTTQDYSATGCTIGALSSSNEPSHIDLSNLRVVVGTAVYTSNFTPPTSDLTNISGTILLTAQDSTIKDNSSNNLTITTTSGSPFATRTFPYIQDNNTDGSITSTVLANPASGFSVVTYTGNGAAGATVGHGLSSAPKMIILKNRSISSNWHVYHESIGATKGLILNLTNAEATSTLFWNDTAPTSSVFSLGLYGGGNGSGNSHVAYCFSEVAGYSKFGSYTGNGSTSGPTVTTGFRPAWIMFKRTDNTNDWYIWDNTRTVNNPRGNFVKANTSDTENSADIVNFTDTGFEIISNSSAVNTSSGTYIYMAFADTRDAHFSFDASGNKNNWTPNNINSNASSETTYDIMNDVATLTDEDTANFATLNPLDISGTVSNGNLTTSVNANIGTKGTIAVSEGKWYWEVSVDSGVNHYLGAAPSTLNTQGYVPGNSFAINRLGNIYAAGSYVSKVGLASYGPGDVIGMAVDFDNKKVWWSKNGQFYTADSGTATAIANSVVEAGNNAYVFTSLTDPEWTSWGASSSGTSVFSYNFGQRPFKYTPPTGYKKLNTYNLPDNTIKDGSQYFDVDTWSGDSNATTQIPTPFSPDFVWIKNRSNTGGSGAASHMLYDTIRGVQKELQTNLSNAEGTTSTGLNSFDSDGYKPGTSTRTNATGNTYVGWSWRGSDSSAVSNTDGTITSTVSANTDSGFSVVAYTGNNIAGATIGHGLGLTPKVIITKNRDATGSWIFGHNSIGWTKYLKLEGTDAETTATTRWNNTAPTSSNFTVGTYSGVNGSGANMIAYCFAEVEGFSKFGSYTGNGSADGPFVYTGFRPAFVLVKRTDGVQNWTMYDSARDTDNVVQNLLVPNTSGAEATYAIYDFLSNGFKLRNTDTAFNGSGANYIYMAFAENPFKQSLAR